MPTLEEQLDRMSRRGPYADPSEVLRSAERHAAAPFHASRAVAGRPAPVWPLRLAVGAFGLAGVTAMTWLATAEPPAPGADVRVPAPATPATTATVPSSSRPPMSAEDTATLATLYALLDVETADELVVAFSSNVPPDEMARCMTAAGFDYVAGPSPEEEVAAMPQYRLSAAEFAATLGLGIASQELGTYVTLPDPNLGYLELPVEEQERYGAQEFECRGGRDPARLARSTAWSSAVAQFHDLLESDPRVADATAAWRTCLADRGYSYDSRMSLMEDFSARLGPLSRRRYEGEDVEAELRALLDQEIAVAVANVPCEAAYVEEYRSVVFDRFAEFTTVLAATTAAAADGGG